MRGDLQQSPLGQTKSLPLPPSTLFLLLNQHRLEVLSQSDLLRYRRCRALRDSLYIKAHLQIPFHKVPNKHFRDVENSVACGIPRQSLLRPTRSRRAVPLLLWSLCSFLLSQLMLLTNRIRLQKKKKKSRLPSLTRTPVEPGSPSAGHQVWTSCLPFCQKPGPTQLWGALKVWWKNIPRYCAPRYK